MNRIKSERGTWDRVDRWFCVNLNLPFRIWWHKLWVRHGQDEEHPSLELDVNYMAAISPKRRDAYTQI